MKFTFKFEDLKTLGQNIWVFAITGGPCSGKTTGMKRLRKKLERLGYKVLVVPEVATKFISGGIEPTDAPDGMSQQEFQELVLLEILVLENSFFKAAKRYRDMGHKVVVLCDRGTMDGEAYISEKEYAHMVKKFGMNLRDLSDHRYHAVIHMRTAARGAVHKYTCANNKSRKEGPKLARKVDRLTLNAWLRHRHLRVIDNSTNFRNKIGRLIDEVLSVISSVERERKFLLKSFDLSKFTVPYRVSEITQTYLISEADVERRVRARSDEHGTSYFYTTKRNKKGKNAGRHEDDPLISKQRYLSLLKRKDPKSVTIRKKRICFCWNERFFEIDVYLQGGSATVVGMAVMEHELGRKESMKGKIKMPPFIPIDREITGVKKFGNRAVSSGKGWEEVEAAA